jgi:hypothetical protein
MGRWLLSKVLFYLLVFSAFYLIGLTLGIIPQSIKDVVSWFAGNFLLISILLMFFMAFIIMMRLTSPKRSQTE